MLRRILMALSRAIRRAGADVWAGLYEPLEWSWRAARTALGIGLAPAAAVVDALTLTPTPLEAEGDYTARRLAGVESAAERTRERLSRRPLAAVDVVKAHAAAWALADPGRPDPARLPDASHLPLEVRIFLEDRLDFHGALALRRLFDYQIDEFLTGRREVPGIRMPRPVEVGRVRAALAEAEAVIETESETTTLKI